MHMSEMANSGYIDTNSGYIDTSGFSSTLNGGMMEAAIFQDEISGLTTGQSSPPTKLASNPPFPTLFVANFGPTCFEEELTQVFSICPRFLKLKMKIRGGLSISFVDFQDNTSSTQALNNIQNTMLLLFNQGGMRLEYAKSMIHYVFQYIFVNCLEEVDPCDDLTDEDIRTTIQNATFPKNSLFVLEVPLEVLVRRKITRLLDPSLQCGHFIYEELVNISHQRETIELHRFSILRRHLEEVVGTFLCEGLALVETMIAHLISWRWTISILHIHDLLVEAKQWKLRYNNTYMSRFHSPPLN